jgi:hypothetical protein
VHIPPDEQGRPQVSITMLRTYGVAPHRLADFEQARGCPLQYRLKYVDRALPERPTPVGLRIGLVLHDALHRMERDGLGPEDALQAAHSAAPLEFGEWVQARDILTKYMERVDTADQYASLGQEVMLSAELYTDEEHGPVVFRGRLDDVLLDIQHENTLHGVDHKGAWQSPTDDQVRGDVQLRSQHWLLQRCYDQFGFDVEPRIIMHLNSLRYRDKPVEYTPDEITEWHEWAVAMVRRILRDEHGQPELNEGCGWCPAHSQCPAWLGLPGTLPAIDARVTGLAHEELVDRYQRLTLHSKLLADAQAEALRALTGLARLAGDEGIRVGAQRWRPVTAWADEVDHTELHRTLGPLYYTAVTTSRAAIERATVGKPALRARALDCIGRTPAGMKIERRKAQ